MPGAREDRIRTSARSRSVKTALFRPPVGIAASSVERIDEPMGCSLNSATPAPRLAHLPGECGFGGHPIIKLCSRDDVGPQSPVKTVDSKIFAIHSEDFSDAFTLSNPNQRCIGKVHRTVGVLTHQLAHSRNVSEIERQKLQYSSHEHFPKSLLGFGQVAQQIHCFRYWRPHRDQGFSQQFQGGYAFLVKLIIRINQSNERPRIHRNHARFLRSFRISLKPQPVSDERSGFPP